MVPPLTFRPSIQFLDGGVLAIAVSCHFSSLSVSVTFGFSHSRFQPLSVSDIFGSRDRIPINQSIRGARFIVWRSATQWAMCGKH